MKAIITVVGKDKAGIVASVSAKIAEFGLNIDDISQTVLDDFFTMMAVVSSDENKISQNYALNLKHMVTRSTSKLTFKAQRFLMLCTIFKEASCGY